ncbi:MAG: hypothetical protein QM296_04065 [Bacillota bacterium]|nr:hypothetical protein [Bacillota bacterium]
MSFIKVQKLVRDESGRIVSGSAAIVESRYVKGAKYHSKQVVVERLGSVIYLDESGKRGIFQSPSRGLVEYDAQSGIFMPVDKDDERLQDHALFPEPVIHTIFGDSWLLLSLLEKSGLGAVLRSAFPKKEEHQRLLCHVLHQILRDGSRISCDNLLRRSFASYLLTDVPLTSLRSDSLFFQRLGKETARLSFFTAFAAHMRTLTPSFGRACYVDSMPLPNEIENNPFSTLCCHGLGSDAVKMRLILLLDEETALPVWYDIIPGNDPDLGSIRSVMEDAFGKLQISIESFVLDTDYVAEDLLNANHIGNNKELIYRMPARRSYPYESLYHEVKPLLGRGSYDFVRKSHLYFGYRKEIRLFDTPVYAYIYVDQNQALQHYHKHLEENPEAYEKMKESEKDWMKVKFGYFVLLSNKDTSPEKLLSEYLGRVDVETTFKTSRDYLDLLPLSKWNDQAVRGKILFDIINAIVLQMIDKEIGGKALSISELLGRAQSLMCSKNKEGIVTTEVADQTLKDYFSHFGLRIPAHIKVDDAKKQFLI